jgi:hypothetical protein
MTALDRYTHMTCWLASVAYAARFKRVGRQYLTGAIYAYALEPEAEVVMSGRLPGCPRMLSVN